MPNLWLCPVVSHNPHAQNKVRYRRLPRGQGEEQSPFAILNAQLIDAFRVWGIYQQLNQALNCGRDFGYPILQFLSSPHKMKLGHGGTQTKWKAQNNASRNITAQPFESTTNVEQT